MTRSNVSAEAAQPSQTDPELKRNLSPVRKLGQTAAQCFRKMSLNAMSLPPWTLITATCRLLFHLFSHRLLEYFDTYGETFSHLLKRPDRGPAARSDRLSLLEELTPAQLESLSAPQLAKLLQQRGHANKQAITDRFGVLGLSASGRPFLKSETQECKQTLCPACGKGMMGEEVSYVDLDGILRGDIPPTVALGYGFRKSGRPVADVSVARNIGLRRLPEKSAQAVQTPQGGQKVQGEGKKAEECSVPDLKDDDEAGFNNSTYPLTPSNTFLNMSDSSEDLLELYTDGSSVEVSQDNSKAQDKASGEK
ncbi:hypothetical protein KVR01_008580 [Diaporthe batatas]|uniref:uncharacterized protein n=1 Tax=Diaporthe batatas TaxID=748121 RepID=UPI001D049A26|nr:uncharacterized protein KVR01_008580 [Diaporthe batatas]KAG8161593.1 hypothetical protein KVR01_008580 [Diaporthe batatas]